MYYSKTFVPGQFSPDYWEASTYGVLGSFTVGKIIGSRPVQPTVSMNRTTSTHIADLDETDLNRPSLSASGIYVVEALKEVVLNSTTIEGKLLAFSEEVNTVLNERILDSVGLFTVAESSFSDIQVTDVYNSINLSTLDLGYVNGIRATSSYTSNFPIDILEPVEFTLDTNSKVYLGISSTEIADLEVSSFGLLYPKLESNLVLADSPSSGSVGSLKFAVEEYNPVVQLNNKHVSELVKFSDGQTFQGIVMQTRAPTSSIGGTYEGNVLAGESTVANISPNTVQLGATPFNI